MSWFRSELLGTWQGLERQQDSAFGPGGDARAMITWKYDLGEAIVVQDYRQVRADGTEFAAHGVFVPTGPGISWWQFDTSGTLPVVAAGRFVDDELVVTKRSDRGTAEHRWRVADDQLEYRIGYGPPGAEPQPFLGGRYRRLDTH